MGAVAAGGCGTPTDNDAGGWASDPKLLLDVPFVIADGWLIGDEINGVEIECAADVGGMDVLKPFASVVNG